MNCPVYVIDPQRYAFDNTWKLFMTFFNKSNLTLSASKRYACKKKRKKNETAMQEAEERKPKNTNGI